MKFKYDAVVADKKGEKYYVSGVVTSDDTLLIYSDISNKLFDRSKKPTTYKVVSLTKEIIEEKASAVSYAVACPQYFDTPVVSYEVAVMDKKGKLHTIPSFPVHAFDRIAKLSAKTGVVLFLVETRRTLSSNSRVGFYKESIIKTSISEA